MNKKPLIVFSGGMDSTKMLQNALAVGDVYTCYFEASQSPEKIHLEREARRKIMKILQEKMPNRIISDMVVKLGWVDSEVYLLPTAEDPSHTRSGHMPDVTWQQAHMWLRGLIYVTDSTIHSEVQMGNVMGDSINAHLDNMKQAWHYTQLFSKRESIPLVFPLALQRKDTIINELYPEVVPHLWICELPRNDEKEKVFKPCGHCQACATMAKTIWWWEQSRGRNYREYIEAVLADRNEPSLKMESE